MQTLIVVNDPADWGLSIAGVELVSARAYLTGPTFTALKRARVLNLCRSFRYQSIGYYVSLLAEARGHRPKPSVATILDMKLQVLPKPISGDLDVRVHRDLIGRRSRRLELAIFFGAHPDPRLGRLAAHLFGLFPAPLIHAELCRDGASWRLVRIAPIPAGQISPGQRRFVAAAAEAYFDRPARRPRARVMRYDMAILTGDEAGMQPSNPLAIQRFVRAAGRLGINAETIGRADAGRIAEYDALFIRDTTFVNHYTFRLSRRAQAEGLVVIDDPDTILKCTNKVYLAQLLARHRVPIPPTLIVHAGNTHDVAPCLGLPCILKQPDSAFSLGVSKVESPAALRAALAALLGRSELIIAQAFVPTAFDWRVGMLDGRVLYACRYHMARGHWQIVRRTACGRPDCGRVAAVPLATVPRAVLACARRAGRLLGQGLLGVDVKEVGGRAMVLEVNDNPCIDAGGEDGHLGQELYRQIMASFWRRLEARRRKGQR